MDRPFTDRRKKKSRPTARPARKSCVKIDALTLTIPQPLSDKAASFLGSEVANDPAFWMIALSRGIEELERQFREIEAEAKREADEGGYTVIFGAPTIIGRSEPCGDEPDGDDPDGIPF